MRCALLFARDERPGALVLDCVVSDGDGAGDATTPVGAPVSIELATPGRSVLDQLSVASIRRWAATGAVRQVEVRRSPDGAALRVDIRAAGRARAVVDPTRVVGVDVRSLT